MKIKEGFKIREIAGEKVLIMQGRLGINMTKIISFNATAEWLWNELYNIDFTIDDATELLVKHFRIDKAIAEKDASKWIEQLINCNVIEL